jgi:hypothetical protein
MDEENPSSFPFNKLNRGSLGRVGHLIFGSGHSSNNEEAIPLSTFEKKSVWNKNLYFECILTHFRARKPRKSE